MAGTELEAPRLLLTKPSLGERLPTRATAEAPASRQGSAAGTALGREQAVDGVLVIPRFPQAMGRDRWAAAPMSQKPFCGKTRLRLINAGALTCSIVIHTPTIPTAVCHRGRCRPSACSHTASVNMQTPGKAPAFEILLLCFPSKRFIFLSPLTALATAPSPAADSKFHPVPGCRV